MVLYPQSDWRDIWCRLQIEPKRKSEDEKFTIKLILIGIKLIFGSFFQIPGLTGNPSSGGRLSNTRPSCNAASQGS